MKGPDKRDANPVTSVIISDPDNPGHLIADYLQEVGWESGGVYGYLQVDDTALTLRPRNGLVVSVEVLDCQGHTIFCLDRQSGSVAIPVEQLREAYQGEALFACV